MHRPSQANQREWLVHLLALVLEWMQTYYDILQAAIVKMEEQLTSAGAASVAAGAEGQEWVDNSIYITECTLLACPGYRIARYFRGRKCSRISRIFAVTRKYYSRKKVGVIIKHLSRSLRLYSKPTIAVIHEIIFREMH